MKKYVKPTFEFVELRPEESIASMGSATKGNCAGGNPESSPGLSKK